MREENVLTVWVVKYWIRLRRVTVESEDTRNWSRQGPWQPAVADPDLFKSTEQMISRSALQPQLLWFSNQQFWTFKIALNWS